MVHDKAAAQIDVHLAEQLVTEQEAKETILILAWERLAAGLERREPIAVAAPAVSVGVAGETAAAVE